MKTVLVTGIGRGIGRSICERFLEEGYVVYGTYNTSKDEVLNMQKQYGKDKIIVFGPYDFAKVNDTERLINELKDFEFDSIVCSAGMFSESDDFLGFDLEEFNNVMNCNFYAPLLLCVKLQDNIKDNGSIIIMSSNDAYSGAFSSISYSVSKVALLTLMQSLCVNYGSRNIRVNSVAPGAINTSMNTPEQEFDAPKYTPISRIGQPEEVAETVYFLASGRASFINGTNVTIDGGYGNVSILLKNEAIRNRHTHECLYKLLDTIKKDEQIDVLSYCCDNEMNDNDPKEITFLNKHIEAMERGVKIRRIFILTEDIIDKIKNTYIIKQLIEKTNLYDNCENIFIMMSDLDKQSLETFKGSMTIFNGEYIFLDDFKNDNYIGVLYKNSKKVEKYLSQYNKLFEMIKSNKIKKYEI